MTAQTVYFQKTQGSGLPLQPTKAYDGDAGWDLYTSEDVSVAPGQIINVPTQIAMALPRGYYGQIVGRSSAALRKKLLVVPAVIDAGYRGEMFVMVQSQDDYMTKIHQHTRIAQLLILPVPEIGWVEVKALPHSERGDRGFGSSGGHDGSR